MDSSAPLGADLDVVCVGEALVDFLPHQVGRKVADVESWTRCSGGSPANVAVGLARLGAKSAMLGVVGEDEFGSFLVRSLAEEGVDISRLRQTDEGKTGLVFVSLSDAGERTFAFYRTRAAELFLSARDVDWAFVQRTKAVHCGTNSLLFREAQRAVVKLAQDAAAAGKIVSCDPNLRLHLWPDPADLRTLLGLLLPSCTVLKLSLEEIEFVTGVNDDARALESLAKMGIALPIVTGGPAGAAFLWQGRLVRVPAPPARVLDSTGAGDGFVAGLLFGLTRLYPDAASLRRAGIGELRELVGFACTVGSRVVEKLGAVAGLPRMSEIHDALPGLLKTA